jgi:N6-adenosine-specific RNA methylase IME4
LYDVILIDPPWTYYGSKDGMGDVGKEYATLTDEQILSIRYPLAKNGVLFLWATGPRLNFAIKYIEETGLYFRGVAFVWVKTKKDGCTPLGAQGVRPSIVKPIDEFVLVASPVKKGRPLPIADESVNQNVLAPRMGHSIKPEQVQDRIERLYPSAKKAEFFARRHRVGWDCFGLELGNWDALKQG